MPSLGLLRRGGNATPVETVYACPLFVPHELLGRPEISHHLMQAIDFKDFALIPSNFNSCKLLI